jgi:hypothetical protein
MFVLEQTQDEQEIIEWVAALGIGKAELVCCVRVPTRTTSVRTSTAPGSTQNPRTPEPQRRNRIGELEALGYRVTLQPAA